MHTSDVSNNTNPLPILDSLYLGGAFGGPIWSELHMHYLLIQDHYIGRPQSINVPFLSDVCKDQSRNILWSCKRWPLCLEASKWILHYLQLMYKLQNCHGIVHCEALYFYFWHRVFFFILAVLFNCFFLLLQLCELFLKVIP